MLKTVKKQRKFENLRYACVKHLGLSCIVFDKVISIIAGDTIDMRDFVSEFFSVNFSVFFSVFLSKFKNEALATYYSCLFQ